MQASAADGHPPARSSLRPVDSGAGDRWIRWTTTASVVLRAGVAAVVSFRHMYALTLAHGESALAAALIPLSVDGMIIASSMTLLADSRADRAGGLLPWVLLAIGSAVSLAANVAVAASSRVAENSRSASATRRALLLRRSSARRGARCATASSPKISATMGAMVGWSRAARRDVAVAASSSATTQARGVGAVGATARRGWPHRGRRRSSNP